MKVARAFEAVPRNLILNGVLFAQPILIMAVPRALEVVVLPADAALFLTRGEVCAVQPALTVAEACITDLASRALRGVVIIVTIRTTNDPSTDKVVPKYRLVLLRNFSSSIREVIITSSKEK